MLTELFNNDCFILMGKAIFFIVKILLGLGSIYLILQRFHLRLQMRFLKNISDEIIKINDYIIEFQSKFELFKSSISEVDRKNYYEIYSIRNKVHNHLDYLTSLVNSFPYGNPVNFFWYSLKGKYYDNKTQIKADSLLTNYQSLITDDTILQKDIDLIGFVKIKVNLSNQQKIIISEIHQQKIDDITVNGIDLIELLEDHSKKLF